MRFRWPKDTAFSRLVLEVEDRDCPACGRRMSICDHRHHPIFTLQGPTDLVCKLVHCPDATCTSRPRTFSPLAETAIALPYWLIGWDVFCWIGHRRFSRHRPISQIREELLDSYKIPLSHDAIGDYILRYQTMLAARQQDAQLLAQEYHAVDGLVLAIDGLQPEKGHETLYVVRELTRKRVWFAEALISSSADEVRRLLAKARAWAEQLGKRVALWTSDKQDAFLSGIAAEFPGTPHRYCSNHFLLDLAKPILEADSHTKVNMRGKVRGLRAIEREVLQEQAQDASVSIADSVSISVEQSTATLCPAETVDVVSNDTAMEPANAVALDMPPQQNANDASACVQEPTPTFAPIATVSLIANGAALEPASAVVLDMPPQQSANDASVQEPTPMFAPIETVSLIAKGAALEAASAVVLDYCSAVRGILNDDQGGPLHPPGLRMAEALRDVQASLQRNLEAKKGGALTSNCSAWPTASTVV
jgi:hypothetical protein